VAEVHDAPVELSSRGLSAPIPKYDHVFRAGHPALLRCSFLEYSRYPRSFRLAIRAPRSGLLLP